MLQSGFITDRHSKALRSLQRLHFLARVRNDYMEKEKTSSYPPPSPCPSAAAPVPACRPKAHSTSWTQSQPHHLIQREDKRDKSCLILNQSIAHISPSFTALNKQRYCAKSTALQTCNSSQKLKLLANLLIQNTNTLMLYLLLEHCLI